LGGVIFRASGVAKNQIYTDGYLAKSKHTKVGYYIKENTLSLSWVSFFTAIIGAVIGDSIAGYFSIKATNTAFENQKTLA